MLTPQMISAVNYEMHTVNYDDRDIEIWNMNEGA